MGKIKLIVFLGIIILSACIAYFFAKINQSDKQSQNQTQESNATTDIEFFNTLNPFANVYLLLTIDSDKNEMMQTYENEANARFPETFTITQDGTILDNVFVKNPQDSKPHISDKMQYAKIYGIETLNDNAIKIFMKNDDAISNAQLQYRFSWIDKQAGLADINGQCFIASTKLESSDFHDKIYGENFLIKDTTQYMNEPTKNNISKKLLTSELFYNPEYLSDTLTPHALTLQVQDSTLRDVNASPKTMTFPYALILQDFQDTTQKLVIIFNLKDSTSNPQNILVSPHYQNAQDSANNQSAMTIDDGLFLYDNIESAFLYKLNNDNSIDMSFGLNITPFKRTIDNPCKPHEYQSNDFWIYQDGSFYIQTTQFYLTQDTQPHYTTHNLKHYDISHFSTDTGFIPTQDSFNITDCSANNCQNAQQDNIYISQCKDSCLIFMQWHIRNELNATQKEIYLNRFKVMQSLSNTTTNSIQTQIINDDMQKFQWILLKDEKLDNLFRPIPLPESPQEHIQFVLAFTKDKEPLILDFTQQDFIAQLNTYFDSKTFSNALMPRSLSKKIICESCALFIPHSSLESVQKSLIDTQFFISSQNVFLANNIALHQVDEYIKEMIFEKEGMFGSDKKIECTENLGNWVLYKKGKAPKIIKQSDFTDKQIQKYFK